VMEGKIYAFSSISSSLIDNNTLSLWGNSFSN